MRANKYFLLFIFSIFASCSQGGKGNNFAKTKEDFGPKKQDTIVSQKANTIKKIDWHYAGWISTHEFMQSLVTLFEFAPESKVPFEMLDKYYSNPNTTTTVDIANGTYVEAALGIYGPDIFNSITESNIKNYSLIKKSFDNWDTMIPQGLTPSQVVARLIGFLKQLPAHLIKNGVSVSVSKGVGNSIEKYVDILNTTKDRLSFIKTNKSEGMLAYNLTIIQDTLSDLIKSGIVTKDSMAPTMESLKFPLGLLPKFQEKTHKNISYILFSILLQKRNEYLLKLGKEDISSLTAEEVSALVLEFPKTMQDFATNFVSESDEAISWYMKGEYAAFSSPLRSIYLNRLLSKLEESDAEKMLLEIEYQISTTVYNQLLSVLYDKTRTLPNTVEVIVVSQFSRSEQHFYYDFYNQIKKIAADRIKEDLLSGEAKFPGIEGKYVYWPIEDTKSTYKSYFLTGAKEIGSSIQANIFFLENINATSSLPDSDKKFKTYTFSLLNRLLAIFGYRNFHGVLSNSLHQRFTPTKSANFDIYSYDVEPGIYALPDNLLLDYGYKTSGKIDQRLVQTVSGRASLLKASAKLIDFFAVYNHNSFDDIFSTFQFEGFSVFPKEPIFDLSLGSVSILLRNLTKGEAVFFDLNGNLLPATGNIFQDAKGAGSLALLSREGDKVYDSVQGEDTAEYIIALSSLLKSVKKLPNAKVGLLSKLTNGKQADLDAIMSLLPNLRKLQYGLGLFLYNKMVVDGWLANTFFIKDKSIISKDHNLTRQLKLIQAMLSIYNEWNSEIFLWAAVDAYYVLNKELLKSDQVGYKLNESFPMYEVTETWKTLLGLQSAIQNLEKDKKTWWSQESETQLNDLLMYYQKNWQELSNVH